MRSFVTFAAGVLVAALGLWFVFPERVHFVVQVADDHAVREPPRPLADDTTAVKLASLERALAALQTSVAALPSRADLDRASRDTDARRAKEAAEAKAVAVKLEQQVMELRQTVAALAATLAAAPLQTLPPDAVVTELPVPAPVEAPVPEVVPAPAPEPASAPAPEPPAPPPPPPRTLFKLVENGSKVGFDGSSNLHDFTGATTAVKGEIEFRLDAQADAPRAYVEIDARTLDTGNGSRDKEMHGDYLQSKKWTTMQFEIQSLVDLKQDGATRFQARARGVFTCHGKAKQVEAAFKAERVGATGLRIEGELPLKMSDFGITPPTAMGGLIRTHDDVRVWFVLQGRCEP